MSKRQWVLAVAILLNLAFLVGLYLHRHAKNQAATNLAADAEGIRIQPGLVTSGDSSSAGNQSRDAADPAESRLAAQRSQSKNSLRMIALALHNYLAAKNGFPAGAHPHPTLPVEKRISWMADILPYFEQNDAFRSVDFTKAWDDPVHERLTKFEIGVLHTPILEDGTKAPAGFTQYVGIAGVGEDAPRLPVVDPRAGAFGLNDPRTLADFRDGTSNTLLVTEASGQFGPWIAAGPATLRSLTRQPYINGPDGIGGPFKGGVHAAFADASARFISEKIDPKIFEALSTINGGEPIPQIP